MKRLGLLLLNPRARNKINKSIGFFIIPILKFAGIFFTKENHYIEQELRRIYQNIIIFPDIYIDFLVLSEDKRFYIHKGVDFFSICRALVSIAFLRRMQGASTIEQQLVRTITKDYRISINRKIKEQVFAILVSSQFSKKEIAVLYLNVAYVGNFDKKLLLRGEEVDHALSFIAAIRYPVPKKNNSAWLNKYNIRKRIILEKHSSIVPADLTPKI